MLHIQDDDAASLTREGDKIILKCDYDENLIEAIKEGIPAHLHLRRWDPKRKVWVFNEVCGKLVISLVANYLGVNLGMPK